MRGSLDIERMERAPRLLASSDKPLICGYGRTLPAKPMHETFSVVAILGVAAGRP